jgi:serine/threonine protein kinase/Tol biopolymer transport system component
MSLAAGTRLGPYEIQSAIGAGGMGEVYRARDTRLERAVAVKVLPSHLSANVELKQRLDREAKAISGLQHPHICTLYDVGSQDGVDFLVMEYLEGQTLADRLEKGALPLEQTLRIATEIAGAIEKAHAQGITHRDLKPANIMLTKAGAKLMDFGLAKPEMVVSGRSIGPLTPSTPTMNLSSLTSATSPLTQKGSIVGTFQYLAPEVLQGAEADARSDIFSFGCVLYEMVTGRRAFEGKSQLSVLTAILEKEPDAIATTPPVPLMLNRVIRACLTKDPAERLQSAHDLLMDLRWIADSADHSEGKAPHEFKRSWIAWSAAVMAVLLALAGFGGYQWAKGAVTAEPLHAEIPPPDKFLFDATGDSGGMPVLSPQGDKIAFVAHSGDDKSLWVRSLSGDTSHPLEGTRGAMHPFWSPDGASVAFFSGGKLNKVAASGGPITVLADAPNPRGGSWGTDDVIVYAPNFLGTISRVSAQGGTPTAVTVLDPKKHTTHRWPWFLPDGKHFVFLATNHMGGDPQQNGIYFGSVDGSEIRLVRASDSAAQYASGRLLFRSGTALVAQSFDPQGGKLLGSAAPLVSNIRDDVGVWRSIFSTSQNGMLVYQVGNAAAARSRLTWFDRSGKEIGTYDVRENSIIDVRLSPDGKRVAYVTGSPAAAVWTLDLERKAKTRVTFDQQAVSQPAWSPDGKTLVFSLQVAQGGGNAEIRSKASDGSGNEKTLTSESNNYHYPDLSPDGKYLTYIWGDGEKMTSLWLVPLSGEAKPIAIVQPPSAQFNLTGYRVSPDGRWVAYVSDESGQNEVYVTSFPEGKGKWKLSGNGGSYATWSGNSREVFFNNLNDEIFSCLLTPRGGDIEIGTPQKLFHASMPGIGTPYDVSPDGRRFLVNLAEQEGMAPLKIVFNWSSELKK